MSNAKLTIVPKQSELADTSTLKEVLPISKHHFISTTDIKTDVFNITVVRPDIGENQKMVGSGTSSLAKNLGRVSDMDVINLHRQVGEIVARRLLDSISGNKKMQAMIDKVSEKLNIACVALRTNTNWIKELEEIVMRQFGHLKDTAPLKKLLEKKEKEIKELQAILKISDHDPHVLIQDFEKK